jgi:hypothetical protein
MAEQGGAGPRPLLGRISLPNLLIAQVIGLVAGLLALLVGLAAWPALGVAVVVGLLPLIPVAKRTILDWIGTWWRYITRRDYELGDTVDFRGSDGRSLGLYWDGTRVVTVVEVLAPKGGLTRIARTTVHASHLLPLPELAKSSAMATAAVRVRPRARSTNRCWVRCPRPRTGMCGSPSASTRSPARRPPTGAVAVMRAPLAR